MSEGGRSHEAQSVQRRADHATLKENEAGARVDKLCRRHGISSARAARRIPSDILAFRMWSSAFSGDFADQRQALKRGPGVSRAI